MPTYNLSAWEHLLWRMHQQNSEFKADPRCSAYANTVLAQFKADSNTQWSLDAGQNLIDHIAINSSNVDNYHWAIIQQIDAHRYQLDHPID